MVRALAEVTMLRPVRPTQKVAQARWTQVRNCMEVSTF